MAMKLVERLWRTVINNAAVFSGKNSPSIPSKTARATRIRFLISVIDTNNSRVTLPDEKFLIV
jgi:hypothetical protein